MDAELPSSVGLADRYKRHLAERASADDSDGRFSRFRAIYDFLNGGIRFQRGVRGEDPDKSVNIEEIANAALRILNRADDPLAAYVSSWHHRVSELEIGDSRVMSKFVSEMYDQISVWLATPPAERIAYLSRLSDFTSKGFGVSFFTLNYDLLVEEALQAVGTNVTNGMHPDRAEWAPSLFESDDSLRLYKLHGSLDWVNHEIYGICSTRFPRHQRCEDFEGEQRPEIIFGTDQKLSGREPFLSLLFHFSRELQRADILVCVGYSFSDEHINEIIAQRMRENVKMRIIVVQPGASDLISKNVMLRDTNTVSSINSGAKSAFNDNLILTEVDRLLTVQKEEKPF